MSLSSPLKIVKTENKFTVSWLIFKGKKLGHYFIKKKIEVGVIGIFYKKKIKIVKSYECQFLKLMSPLWNLISLAKWINNYFFHHLMFLISKNNKIYKKNHIFYLPYFHSLIFFYLFFLLFYLLISKKISTLQRKQTRESTIIVDTRFYKIYHYYYFTISYIDSPSIFVRVHCHCHFTISTIYIPKTYT